MKTSMKTSLNDFKIILIPGAPCSRTARRRLGFLLWMAVLILGAAGQALAATVQVDVGNGSASFGPDDVTIHAGDTVQWNWSGTMAHSVTSGGNGVASGL